MRTITMIQSGRNRRQQLKCGLGLFLTVFLITRGEVLAAANTSPTIRLFPTTVVENIKHTGEAAKAMEVDLQGVIDRLNQQEELYMASKCEGAEAEQGSNPDPARLPSTRIVQHDEPMPEPADRRARDERPAE